MSIGSSHVPDMDKGVEAETCIAEHRWGSLSWNVSSIVGPMSRLTYSTIAAINTSTFLSNNPLVLCWPWPEARSQAKPSQNQAKPSQAKMLAWVGFGLGLTFWKAKAIGLGQGLSAQLGARLSARLSAHTSAATTSFLMVYSVNCCAQPCTLQKLACTNIYVLYALYFSD